jgi:hypothetical protein
VDTDIAVTMMPKPATAIIASENHSSCEYENRISAVPAMAEAYTGQRVSPRTSRREAR